MTQKILISLTLVLTACTKPSRKLPTIEEYNKETTLMFNICEKLSKESNAKLLNKVATSTLQARVVACTDYFGECNQYGKFLSLAVEVSKDKELTQAERQQLSNSLNQLQVKIREGKRQLKASSK